MPRIPAQTLDSAPRESRELAEKMQEKIGKLLNIHAGMAHSPVVIAAYDGIASAIATHSTFDARTQEAIALAVGNEDGCDYCQSAHTMSAKAAGFSEEQTKAIRSGDIDFDDRLAAVTALAREATANAGSVSEEVWEGMLEAGWSEEERSETFAHIAVNLFTNYFNHYAGTELDVPAAPALT